jgi:prefoldin subunit 5
MDEDLMWFYDDLSEDYKNFRKEAQALEKEYLELRQLLGAAEASLNADPADENLQAKVRYLTKRIKDLEAKAPWLASGLMPEFALWGAPH